MMRDRESLKSCAVTTCLIPRLARSCFIRHSESHWKWARFPNIGMCHWFAGQTDEGDLGISYARADEILNGLLHGFTHEAMRARGFSETELTIVERRLNGTHWKRRPPSVALLSQSGIGESYLRPVDY